MDKRARTLTSTADLTRREFLSTAGSCAAHLAMMSAALPAALRAQLWPAAANDIVAEEPFGRLERIAEGVWALISTPLTGDRTTLCNGGIIAGRAGVVAVEGFFQRAGAEWLAVQARGLTGRWPTQVVLTHFHADHVAGLDGYKAGDPVKLRATRYTVDRALEAQPPNPERNAALRDVEVVDFRQTATIDLGDREISVVPRAGHTNSDVTLELVDPPIVFCGDLVWNRMFPNYVNATPSALSAAVRALPRGSRVQYVPGHGPMARESELDRYVSVLDEIEHAARSAYVAGTPFARAGADYRLPASLGEWVLFNPQFFPRAFEAWYSDLDRQKSGR